VELNKYDTFVHVSEIVKLQEENKELKKLLKEYVGDLTFLNYLSDSEYFNIMEKFNIE